MSYFKIVLKDAFYMYIVQGLNLLLPILVLPYLIKTLSVNSFGIYSFAFAFSQFVLLFVDFGFNISATKKIAENYNNKELVRNTFWNIISIKLFFAIISFVCVFICIYFVDKLKIYSSAIMLSFIMVLGTVFFPIWWFQGFNKIKELAWISTISKVLTYPLIFFLVTQEDDFNAAVIIQSLSFFIAGFFSTWYIFKNNSDYLKNISLTTSRFVYYKEIKESFPIFLSNSSISLYTNSVTIFLGFFSTNYNVGLFGAMERIVRMICFGILGPLTQVSFPIIIRLKNENRKLALNIFKNTVFVVLLLMSLSYVLVFLFKPFLLNHFFSGYKEISNMLNIFMIMIFPISLGGVFGQLGLLGLGEEKEKTIFSRIYIWVGILSIPLTVLSIKLYDIKGAIAAMLFVEIIIFVLFLFYFIKRILRNKLI